MRSSARAADRARFTLDLDSPELAAPAPGVDGLLGRVLAIAYGAMVDGTWSRLKACRNHGCRWAFYDYSREPLGELVLDAALREPHEDALVPPPPRRERLAGLAGSAAPRPTWRRGSQRLGQRRLADSNRRTCQTGE